MAAFEIGDARYRTRPICAADQWALLRRLQPILPAFHGMDFGLRMPGAGIEDVAIALAPLISAKDDDMRAVFTACLAAVERGDGAAWVPVVEKPPLPALMRIATEVVAENFSTLFAMPRARFEAIPDDRPAFAPVSMPDGEDWLLRPVVRGLCKLESLYDGTLKIEHIAKANDALDVNDENQARAQKAAEKKP